MQTPTDQTVTPDALRRRVKELGPWWHNIDLGQGICTKAIAGTGHPEHPKDKWNLLEKYLPASLAGMSVLDIGCSDGYFCLELLRRGAASAHGLDNWDAPLLRARFAAETLGLQPTFQNLQVEAVSPETAGGTFDIVLGLGLLYHVDGPLNALRAIASVSKGLVFLETAILRESRSLRLAKWICPDIRRVATYSSWQQERDNEGGCFRWKCDRDTLLQMVEDAGLRVRTCESYRTSRAFVVCEAP